MGFKVKIKPKPGEAAAPAEAAAPVAKPSFLKTGAAAVKLMDKAAEEAKTLKAIKGGTYRFWLKPGNDAMLTFLDGRIDPATGILDIPYASEHRVLINGENEDVICVEDMEPCPACQSGAKKTFCGYLTVLDHRPWTDKDDVEHEVTRRLYVAKSETLKQLTELASKHENGLIGLSLDVSRTGDRKAAVGDVLELNSEHTLEEVVEHFGEQAQVIDYAAELPYISAEAMNKLGVGKKVATIGSSGFGKGKKKAAFGANKTADDVTEDDIPWK